MTVIIRNFRLEDLTEVIEMSKRAYGYQHERDHLDDLKELESCCLNTLDNQPEGAIVAEVDGKVVGTVFAIKASDGENGYLSWIGVDPNCHGQGIGTAMMEHAEEYLRKMGAKRICLGTDRSAAIPFYLRQGYGLLDCIMVKRLDEDPLEGRSAGLKEIVQALEAYAGFRCKPNNRDQLIEQIELAVADPSVAVAAVEKLAERYAVFQVTDDQREAARKKLVNAVKQLGS